MKYDAILHDYWGAEKERSGKEKDQRPQTQLGRSLTGIRNLTFNSSTSSIKKVRWVLWDKKRATKLLDDYVLWNTHLFDVIQLHNSILLAVAYSNPNSTYSHWPWLNGVLREYACTKLS